MKAKKNSTTRLLRGGGFNIDAASGFLRVTLRFRNYPEDRDRDVGFRFVVRSTR